MLSTAAYRDPDRELVMGPQGSAGPVQMRFSPYAFNGGTVLAIAGEDFSIVASDTRLSEGFSIHTRDSPKCYKLTDKTVIGCSGFHGDCLTLTKIIEARLKMYKHSNNKAMTTGAIAAMLSTILYSRRFFPYYVYNIIGGLDEEGWLQKYAECGACPPDSGQSHEAGERRLHFCSREGCVHWRRPQDLHRDQRGHQGGDCSPSERLMWGQGLELWHVCFIKKKCKGLVFLHRVFSKHDRL
uniref:Proteasome subunit beta n=1 Tax=Rattus norvegicus TaxID=10116 RepID=Q6PDW4_RAT